MGKFSTTLKVGSFIAAVMISGALLAMSLPFSGRKTFSVQTGSMKPGINPGDLVVVNRVPASEVKIGDVITYANPNNPKQTITHRMVQRLSGKNSAGSLVTKGDANFTTDAPVPEKYVIGKVERHIPYLGYFVDFIRKPLGLLLIIYTPALFVVIGELRRLSRYYKSQQPYRLTNARLRKRGMSGKQKAGLLVKTLVLCLTIGVAVTVTARAALFSTATLADNSIIAGENIEHPLLRRVVFNCSLDNTEIVNKLPEIFIFNPSSSDIPTGGWYIESSRGRLVTFPAQTVFDSNADFDIEPDLQDGVSYTGDFMALFNSQGELVDAISWGDDTTYLNPSLPGISDGTEFRRLSTVFDTNTAADWAVTVTTCTP